MRARETILSLIRNAHTANVPHPAPYNPPSIVRDLAEAFAEQAQMVSAHVTRLYDASGVPSAVGNILRARNMELRVHAPSDECDALPWHREAGIAIDRTPPGPDDAAIAFAPYAIAETGTLVYPADAMRPASWHFRPGLEIAIVKADTILPHLEDVLARLRERGPLPGTLNLVTGPSRTADIEQTLELGAHGPKALEILIVR